jgi:nicotinate phosphoribosyltransferase
VSTALLTDRYELTMVQAALRSGKAHRRCVFEVFARQLPAGRRYGVVAGVERALELIEDFRFTDAELTWLEREQVVDAETIGWLANYRFQGDISGYRDGELYFGSSPVLTVTGSFAEAVLLETLILSVLNFDSAIASAASRMVLAAEGRRLIEMGSRRTHESAAVAAARAAYLVGFDATSNLEAGRRYSIPTMGTSAHSFTLLHDSEREAFAAQLNSMGPDTTLLVDTFDVETAVRAAVEMIPGGPGAVRLDSGDLVQQAQTVRALLDSLGATRTRIVVTSDLDEFAIAALAAAPVDGYGVGTSLVSGSGHPTAGFVYKLVAHTDDSENWVEVAKKSALKTNRGGRKFAYRELVNGVATRELLSGQAAPLGRALQTDYLVAGERAERFDLDAGRAHHAGVLAELAGSARRLSKGEPAITVEFAT